LPKVIEIVDGFDVLPMQIDAMSEYSMKDDSKYARDEASEYDHLINALSRGPSESPEKKPYFQQKTKLLGVKEKGKKRKSNIALARELRHECNTMDSDDEEDGALKSRM
jgi:hypothetical protein